MPTPKLSKREFGYTTHNFTHYKNAFREQSYSYQVLYVRSLPANSPKAQAAALGVIAKALKLPSVLNFDGLLKLDAVRRVKDHQLFALLKIILQGGLSDYQQWLSANEVVLTEFGKTI